MRRPVPVIAVQDDRVTERAIVLGCDGLFKETQHKWRVKTCSTEKTVSSRRTKHIHHAQRTEFSGGCIVAHLCSVMLICAEAHDASNSRHTLATSNRKIIF